MEAPRIGVPDYPAILRGMLRRHKRLMAAIFLGLAIPLVAIIFFTREPRFESTGTILVESSPGGRLANLSLNTGEGDGITTTLALLKSRSLGEGVVDALPKESLEELLHRPRYADAMLTLRNQIGQWTGNLSPQQRAVAELQNVRMEFVRETDSNARGPAVVTIKGIASNPRVAMDLVNTYIQVLRNRTRNVDQEEIRKARQFLQIQVQQVQDSLHSAEDSLAKFQQQRGRFKLKAEGDIDLTNLSQAENALAEAQARRGFLATRINSLRQAVSHGTQAGEKGKGSASDLTPTSESVDMLNQFTLAQNRLTALKEKLATLRERYTEAHPQVRATEDDRAAAQARLTELARVLPPVPARASDATRAVQTDWAAAGRELASLEEEEIAQQSKVQSLALRVQQLRSSLRNLSQDEIGYGNLFRDVEAQRNLLTLLSDKLTGARIQEQGDNSVVRVIDPASFPIAPTQSTVHKLLLMALALAGGLAFGAAFGLEFWRQPVETEADVRKATNLTVLGSVGRLGGQTGGGIWRKATSAKMPLCLSGSSASGAIHLELYRAIRAAVETERLKAPFHSILVTSPGPGEGKSTTVLNLASAFQEFGRRVLVIEGDLRCPSLHRTLGIANKPGLVDFLRGTATFDQICRPLPSGVTLIPTQVVREDIGTLLSPARVRELLELSRKRYDVVLFDSAPVLAVPDNLLLLTVFDRVLLVAKASQTSARDLRHAESILERGDARTLGVVLNQANRHDVHYYHRRYAKYYHSERSPAEASKATSAREAH